MEYHMKFHPMSNIFEVAEKVYTGSSAKGTELLHFSFLVMIPIFPFLIEHSKVLVCSLSQYIPIIVLSWVLEKRKTLAQ